MIGTLQKEKPSERYGWYVVGVCMGAYVLSFIDRQILSLLIRPIQQDIGVTDTQFGILSGFAFSLFYALVGIPLAGFSDRMSRPKIIALGIAFWSIATMFCGFAGSFALMFMARVCVGAGEAGLSPATYSLLADLFPKHKLGRATAVYSLGSFVGAGVALLLGGAIVALVGEGGRAIVGGFRPWQIIFLLVGIPGLPLALLVLATIRDPRSKGATARADSPRFSEVVRFLWTRRSIFAPHFLGYSAAAMALFSLFAWAPAYLMRTFDLSPAHSGAALGTIIVVMGGGGVLASGLIMDRFTRQGYPDAPFRTGVIGAAGMIIPILLLPWAGKAELALALLAVAIFFGSFPMPPSTATMQIVAPAQMRARVSAIFLCFNSLLGLGLGSFLVGLLNDRVFVGPVGIGFSITIVVGAATILAALILATGRTPMLRFIEEKEAGTLS
jgi:MFS family permease